MLRLMGLFKEHTRFSQRGGGVQCLLRFPELHRYELAFRGHFPLRGGALQPAQRVGAQPVVFRKEPAMEDHGHASLLSRPASPEERRLLPAVQRRIGLHVSHQAHVVHL